MRAMVLVVIGAACAGLLTSGDPAGARPLHRRAANPHRGGRGEATFPITAGSLGVRANAVGEVVTSRNGLGPIPSASGGRSGRTRTR